MKRFPLIAALLVLVCSCSKTESEDTGVRTLRVCTPESKVQLDQSLNSVLTSGDEFSIFYRSQVNEQWKYAGETGASSGTISYIGGRMETGGKIVALYPYSSYAAYSDGMLYTVIPAKQTYTPGTFAPGSALMYAETEGKDLNFSYVSSFVRLRVSGNGNLKTVVFKGMQDEKVAGATWIDISGPAPVTYVRGSSATGAITLQSESGSISLKDMTEIWISIPAIYYPKGYKITLTYLNGKTQDVVCGPAVDAAPGCVKTLDVMVDNPFGLDVDFTSSTCPFVPVGDFTIPDNSKNGSWTTDEHGTAPSDDGRITSEDGDVVRYTTGGNTYEFVIGASVHQWMENTGRYCAGYYWKPGNFFRFQANGSWLKLPAISGMKLVAVQISITCTSRAMFVSGTQTGGGTQFVIPDRGSAMVYVQNSVVGKSYYLAGTSTRNTQISKLTLYYE